MNLHTWTYIATQPAHTWTHIHISIQIHLKHHRFFLISSETISMTSLSLPFYQVQLSFSLASSRATQGEICSTMRSSFVWPSHGAVNGQQGAAYEAVTWVLSLVSSGRWRCWWPWDTMELGTHQHFTGQWHLSGPGLYSLSCGVTVTALIKISPDRSLLQWMAKWVL